MFEFEPIDFVSVIRPEEVVHNDTGSYLGQEHVDSVYQLHSDISFSLFRPTFFDKSSK